ncbi:MAG TPA: Uma2 family endonuclease [Bryobacteraceae bacterium]|nr:Uma2 family endonuclease [Bryobacteraceae bacterium]
MAAVTGLTIDDFEKLPDVLARNHELVDGELVDVSGNTGGHNELRDLLIALLLPLVKQKKLGMVIAEQEYDFGGNAHGPDVSFFESRKQKSYNRKRRVQLFVPDLAIEIVSQNDKFAALMQKARRYVTCGTKEVWIFHIEGREAYVFSADQRIILNDKQKFQSELIPGFSIRLGKLFDDIAN